jgi:hypothetical protein
VLLEVAGEVRLVVEADGGSHLGGPGALEQQAAGRVDPAPDHVGVRAQAVPAGVSPVSLNQALATFTDVYSPRIIGRVNDYDIKIPAYVDATTGLPIAG